MHPPLWFVVAVALGLAAVLPAADGPHAYPSTKKVVVVKSMQHFHAAYAPIASEVVYVAAPGALVPDWSLLPYTKTTSLAIGA